jgi:hypothetical protein
VVVGKRECELMFQIIWVLREGIDLAPHPPRVLVVTRITRPWARSLITIA